MVQFFAEDITLPHLQRVLAYHACSHLPPATMEVTRAFQMSRESRQELSKRLITLDPIARGGPHYHFMGHKPGELERLMGSSSTTSAPAVAEMPVQPGVACGDVQLGFLSGQSHFSWFVTC